MINLKGTKLPKSSSQSMWQFKKLIEDGLQDGITAAEYLTVVGSTLDRLSSAVKMQNDKYFKNFKKNALYEMKMGFWFVMKELTNPDDSRPEARDESWQKFPWKSEIISAYKCGRDKDTVIRYRYTLDANHSFELSVMLNNTYIKYYGIIEDLENFPYIEKADTYITDEPEIDVLKNMNIEEEWWALIKFCEHHQWSHLSLLNHRWVYQNLQLVYKTTLDTRICLASAHPVFKMFGLTKLYIFKYDKETDTFKYREATDHMLGKYLVDTYEPFDETVKLFDRKSGIKLFEIVDKTGVRYTNLSDEILRAICSIRSKVNTDKRIIWREMSKR